MRPIKLKIKGLNSFVEEQTIDFETLTKQGFFGIFGSTGSGKSTILDGMILALYGVRAMSRGTNEFVNKNCKNAQVSYEFQITGTEVKRYRVEREFKTGEKGTKSGKCRLLDVTEDEKVLEESVTGVDRACVEIIGLTADDFMRTVVLPQGKFSEFLKVSGKDRREILERLFRLEEYGVKLEERIAAALRKEQTEQTRLRGQADVYGSCSQEELEKLQEENNNCKAEITQIGELLRKNLEKAQAYKEIWNLQEEETRLHKEEEELLGQEPSIKEKEKHLLMSDRASHVMPILRSVLELEEKKETLAFKLAQETTEYESRKKGVEFYQKQYAVLEVKKNSEEAKLLSAIEQAKEAVQDYRELPKLLEEQSIKEKRLTESKQQEQTLKEQEETLYQKKDEHGSVLKQLEEARGQCIVTSEYRNMLEESTLRYNELTAILRERKEKEQQTEQKRIQANTMEQELAEIQTKMDRLEEQLEIWKQEEATQDEHVEQIQILKLRKKLRAGEPCPVCGSVHVAHEENNEEGIQEVAFASLETLEMLKKQIEVKETEYQAVKQEYYVKQKLFLAASEEQKELETKTSVITTELETKKDSLQSKLSAYGIQSLKAERERVRSLDQEREALELKWNQMNKQQSEMERSLDEVKNRRQRQEQQTRELEMLLLPLNEKVTQKQERIKAKIGQNKDPNQYLTVLEKEHATLHEQYENAKQKKEEAEKCLKKSEETWQMLSGTKRGNEEALENANIHLERELQKQEFSNREDVKQALLDRACQEQYQTEIEEYTRKRQQTQSEIESVKRRLDGRSADKSEYDEIVRICEMQEAEKKQKEEKKITLCQEIKRMEEQLRQQSKIQKLLSEREHRLALLEDLRSVTRGKRFVEFLATERLRYISKSASKRLYEITNGSYELEINEDGEFIIRDNKNGGVLRQTATLSGGETFVTSLALALALSAEIQLKGTAPLELFFLDEGFGSLDDTLLDIVMESLEKIHNEHLKVGIISHVESVKARVPVRLMVLPAETGVSGSRVHIEYS